MGGLECSITKGGDESGERWYTYRRQLPLNPSPPPHFHPYPQMTIRGSLAQPEYMGVYKRLLTANSAPVFVKSVGDIPSHFMYRCSDGKWQLTCHKSSIAKGRGCQIYSARAADLPSDAGLTWLAVDGEEFEVDTSITCTAVRDKG